MISAPHTCYITVSDLALCQRCPALLTYKLHYGMKDAWRVGIRGGGFPYGSMFHDNIAKVFFKAASHSHHSLHTKIVNAISGGLAGLEGLVREDIFMPFLAGCAENISAGQVMAMARGVNVWVRAMAEFFQCIPSLMRSPEANMHTVFIEPEGKLQSFYTIDGGRLVITGCYDALMFNPDRAEARLFEFKGYRKSDITVPLSQSLIYSWLIWRKSGIVPSVEIIYLDEEEKEPDIFDSNSVKGMIRAGLPDLFCSAFDVISLRRRPEILRDNNLCSVCRFRLNCRRDYDNAFMGKRKGASMVSVLVFFMMAAVITAQVYFFTTLSLEDGIEEREILTKRIRLEKLIESADARLRKSDFTVKTNTTKQYKDSFHNTTSLDRIFSIDTTDGYHVQVYNLNYSFDTNNIDSIKTKDTNANEMNTRIFAAIPPDNPYTSRDLNALRSKDLTTNITTLIIISDDSKDAIFKKISNDAKLKVRKYYLIRAYTKTESGRHILHQALIRSSDVKKQLLVSKDSIDNLGLVDEGITSASIRSDISIDKNYDHERLTYMEVWY